MAPRLAPALSSNNFPSQLRTTTHIASNKTNMKYSATVIAAFSALLATVQGVPVPGQHQPSWSYLSGNSNNGIVAGSGNGGGTWPWCTWW